MQARPISWDKMKTKLNNVKHIKPIMIESILMQGELYDEKSCYMLNNIAVILLKVNENDIFTVLSLDNDIAADDKTLRSFLDTLSPKYSLNLNCLYTTPSSPADNSLTSHILSQNEINMKFNMC
jgi:riboflavin synthase